MEDSSRYEPSRIEPEIQKLWEELGAFQTPDDTSTPPDKRFYCLDMFPYPSGEGLHVGHLLGYTASDIYSRYKRMCGFAVLHPMGWDAFGLPAENTAIKLQVHPRALVEKNVVRFQEQLTRLGFSYDWSLEINTTDPEYYKWTQWIFLKLFHLGLAYEAEVPINWCPSCKTGLANEEVIDGKCERCGTPVEKKNMRQWMLRITKYADRLLRDLDQLDWPEGIKELQRNWIGKSMGVEVEFQVKNSGVAIQVFTTRPDTLFGATYMVLAPEHALVEKLVTPEQRDTVLRYIVISKEKSELERTAVEKEKAGVDTGAKAINPVNGEEIPIWVADYVLASYGTGAIMAVPAHDERDFAFAKKYKLPIREVVIVSEAPAPQRVRGAAKQSLPGSRQQAAGSRELSGAFVDDGVLVNSGEFSGLSSADAREKITVWLEGRGAGRKTVHYKLRDWVFSRQRYWGEPIPLVHCAECGTVPVPEKQLPVLLPEVESYEPTGTGESPLAAISDWVDTKCPNCGKPAKRETNTMPQWAGSCWYFLRFVDPKNSSEFAGWGALERWMPVDLYIGGAEHAVLHLLYARFWMKALYDAGYVPMEEPFKKLRNQGTILGPDGQKMSKSHGNVVSPDEMIKEYGADTLRLYEMFLGPLEQVKPWDPKAIIGVYRFLQRVWKLGNRHPTSPFGLRGAGQATGNTPDSVRRALHKLIKKVTEDLEALKFHTAIAAMMEFVNLAEKEGMAYQDFQTFLMVLSPFAPHLAEALWHSTSEVVPHTTSEVERAQSSMMTQVWPEYDPALMKEEQVTMVVQINGKPRAEIVMLRDADEATVRAAAEKNETVQKWLAGKSVQRVVVVPGRLLNFVTGA